MKKIEIHPKNQEHVRECGKLRKNEKRSFLVTFKMKAGHGTLTKEIVAKLKKYIIVDHLWGTGLVSNVSVTSEIRVK
jgi:hypothetical protein